MQPTSLGATIGAEVSGVGEQGASVQLMVPLLEVMQLVQDGCGQLLREAALFFDEVGDGRRSGASGGTTSSAG